MSNLEQTLSIIKPDAVERNLDKETTKAVTNEAKIAKVTSDETVSDTNEVSEKV